MLSIFLQGSEVKVVKTIKITSNVLFHKLTKAALAAAILFNLALVQK